MDFGLFALAVFVACIVGAIYLRRRGEIQSQFLVTGTLLLVFYIVGIISGLCTIINFLFRWVL